MRHRRSFSEKPIPYQVCTEAAREKEVAITDCYMNLDDLAEAFQASSRSYQRLAVLGLDVLVERFRSHELAVNEAVSGVNEPERVLVPVQSYSPIVRNRMET